MKYQSAILFIPAWINIRGDASMNPCELTAAITAVANSLACMLSNEELTLLSSVFMQLGDTLATIAVQRAICEKINSRE